MYSKAYMYRQEKINDEQIRWRLIKKIENFDRDLEGSNLNHLHFYSPDFSMNLEVDRKEG